MTIFLLALLTLLSMIQGDSNFELIQDARKHNSSAELINSCPIERVLIYKANSKLATLQIITDPATQNPDLPFYYFIHLCYDKLEQILSKKVFFSNKIMGEKKPLPKGCTLPYIPDEDQKVEPCKKGYILGKNLTESVV